MAHNHYELNRKTKQRLLRRVDNYVHYILHKNTHSYSLQDIQDVIQAIDNHIAGHNNSWALESWIFRHSRLLQIWYNFSMDLSI